MRLSPLALVQKMAAASAVYKALVPSRDLGQELYMAGEAYDVLPSHNVPLHYESRAILD
jgi:hypothetical protein